jgi:hypothetical protein
MPNSDHAVRQSRIIAQLRQARLGDLRFLRLESHPQKLVCRTLRIPPFQQERDANSDENESPNQMVVDGDYAHSFEQESGASDQK